MERDLAAWKVEAQGGVDRPTAFIVLKVEEVPEAEHDEQPEDVWQAWVRDPGNLL